MYLFSLLGCLVFYGFYREWISLFISLPGMLTVQAILRCPETVRTEVPARTALEITCRFPTPPVRCRIKLHNRLTGHRYVGEPGERIPTKHCGCMSVSCDRLFVYDYLGLFRRRLPKSEKPLVYVLPKPVACPLPQQLQGRSVSLWRPKPGGGFSENHELREFRVGDEVRGIHWKMSAKTRKLIYREPIEPAQTGYLLSLTLTGDPDALDKKLGQLLWLNHTLLQRGFDHGVRCRTAEGMVCYPVESPAAAEEGLKTLLRSNPTKGETREKAENVLWQYHIGGDSVEA